MTVLIRFVLVAVLVGLSSTAWAQSDLFDRGKSIMDRLQPGDTAVPSALGDSEITAALQEALRIGSERVVDQLGRTDGFNADPVIHVPLPEDFTTVQRTLDRVGMAGALDDLELRLNRAAEAATPKARAIFADAIGAMTWDDVRSVYEGPDDAATQYLRSKMSGPLRAEMRPVIDQSLADVGAIAAYDRVMAQYRAVPLVPDVKADLTEHTLERGLDGLFVYLAREEAAIRNDPAKRTTELLQQVFGPR